MSRRFGATARTERAPERKCGALEWAYAQADKQGKTVGAELERIGWKGSEPVGSRRFGAYVELHIEQGPILEADGATIGIVTGGQGLTWLRVGLSGSSAHAGTTPMTRRKDAGLGAARVIELARRIASWHQPDAVATVGRLELSPNATNSVAGRADFDVDLRSPRASVLAAMQRELREGAEAIARELGLGCDIALLRHAEPVIFDEGCVAAVRDAAASLGYTMRDIVSGAGHDAYPLSEVAPTCMIMCPCVDGISHNEAEFIAPEWADAGANVLLHTAVRLAQSL